MSTILRLNGARIWPSTHVASVLKGVEVLSAVSNDSNCVFVDLKRRRIGESRQKYSRSTSLTASSGGGEGAGTTGKKVDKGKESRMRLQ